MNHDRPGYVSLGRLGQVRTSYAGRGRDSSCYARLGEAKPSCAMLSQVGPG